MSRSRKKPYIKLMGTRERIMKRWKKMCNSRVRSIAIDQDIYQVKKLNDRWTSPDDGAILYDPDNPKAYRK